jgi:hypothetical protein
MSPQPDDVYLTELEQVSFRPVFILGLHRSGTSILYKMLTATGCFNPVIAYHLLRYDQLLRDFHTKQTKTAQTKLTQSLVQQGLSDRGIDRLSITADFAEEYGFLLGTRTIGMSLTSRNLALFIELCKKIQFIADNDKPVLLKNPYDFANFLYIKQMFPQAKFVFIHRHPYKTLSSTIKAVRLLLQHKNPYTTQLFRLYRMLFQQPLLLLFTRLLFTRCSVLAMLLYTMTAAQATKYYLKNRRKLPHTSYASLSYEELCSNPQQIMENVMDTLDIPLTTSVDFTSFIQPRKTRLDPSVTKLKGFIASCMKPYFSRFGYHQDDYD